VWLNIRDDFDKITAQAVSLIWTYQRGQLEYRRSNPFPQSCFQQFDYFHDRSSKPKHGVTR